MVDPELTLLLIPLAPGLIFMLWVIWALEKQMKCDRRHSDEIAGLKAGSNGSAPAGGVPKQHGSGTYTQRSSAGQP
jgi:hypothetical protein